MTHRIRIRGVEREFDPNQYAHLVIALAKELAGQEPEVERKEKRDRKRRDQDRER
jgi:hypothetical protein